MRLRANRLFLFLSFSESSLSKGRRDAARRILSGACFLTIY